MMYSIWHFVRLAFVIALVLGDKSNDMDNKEIGVIVKPTLLKSVDIMYEIDKYYDKLRYVKESNEVDEDFNRILNKFYNSNTCLSYSLTEYELKMNDENSKNNNNNELIISIDLDVLDRPENSKLNINILDNNGNLLRRKLNLSELQFQILLSINLQKINEIIICFENEVNDYKSNLDVLLNLQLQFGIPSIMQSFDKSTNQLENNFDFVKVEKELDLIIAELNEKLVVSEKLLRNVNESNYEMVTRFGIILICGLILFNIFSLVWLIRYLKTRKLIN